MICSAIDYGSYIVRISTIPLGVMWWIATATAVIADSPSSQKTFPIMAWDYVDDEAILKSMADCGINAVAFVPPKMLDALAKYGLKGIVHDDRVGAAFGKPFDADRALPALEELIRNYGNHPALYGYHLRDEPGPDQFDDLGRASTLIREKNPGKWPYICNYPGYGDDYVKLLEDFVARCNPPILTYDNYAARPDGSFSWGFWANIADVRQVALSHDLPFHAIVLTSPHWGYGPVTPENLRLQAYGSLAYGARGLEYYKFCSGSLPILNAPDLGNFRDGPLDEFGDKTQTWGWLRNVNRQMLNLAPHLLKLRSDNVYHIGDVPQRNHGPGENALVKALPGGSDWIVGEFTHEDGSRWVMIVNKVLTSSAGGDIEFNVPVKEVQYVYPITGELRKYPMPWFQLSPGAGVLLKLIENGDNTQDAKQVSPQ